MSNEMTCGEIIELFRSIYRRFEKIEGRPWGVDGAMIELAKQVGELAKYVMVAEGYYLAGHEHGLGYETNKEAIGNQLIDILAMAIRIADYYGIDLAEASLNAGRSAGGSPMQTGV